MLNFADIKSGFTGLLVATAVRGLMSTLDFKVACYEPGSDPGLPDCAGRAIYIFWHEYILFPFALRGHCNLTMLLSQHRDADWIASAAKLMGFGTVRGSSTRGALSAIREMERQSLNNHLTITPDGPRGPRRHLAQGPIYLASKLQLPIICLGFGHDTPWRMPTWDHFAVPKPFSRARCIIGPRMHIPAKLDRDGIEECRVRIEHLLNVITLDAEAWAESRTRKIEQRTMYREALPGRTGDEVATLRPFLLDEDDRESARDSQRRAG